MAQKTGNEETEFKVAPPCINSRAATKTPPPPETPPQITSSSSPSPLTSSSHSLTSSSPSSSMKSLMSASSRSSPVVTSHMLTNSSSPLEKSSPPVMTSSSSPSHPSSLPVESQRCSQLTSSSPSMLTSSSPVMKLGDSAKEKRKLTEEEAYLSIPTKRKVNRCSGCSKKVGLTGFRCRCGQLFCSAHRYSDRHDCSFDYKSAGREAIARENPVIKAAKILKI